EQAGEWLLQVADRVEPDLIHLNGYVHGTLPWRAPVLMVGHSCVLSWWEAVKGETAPPEWDTYRELVTQGLRCANMVVAPTKTMLGWLDRLYGPLKSLRHIYNARDPRDFHPEGKARLVFASGRLWDEAKNLSVLEKIAPKLSWPLYLAGDNLAPGSDGLEVGNNMRHLGHLAQPEIAHWFRRAGIYVHPARYEPFGLCVLEAALAGCALVLGDIPTLRELWDGAAIFAAPDDHEALTRGVNALVTDADRRHQLAAAARERAADFAPAKMAAEYLNAYQELRVGSNLTERVQAR
ncbi:MAG: glycosyltransferase family 4 protein, partial [Bacteroidota bacterium]